MKKICTLLYYLILFAFGVFVSKALELHMNDFRWWITGITPILMYWLGALYGYFDKEDKQ